MTKPNIDLGKAILADLNAMKYEDKDVLTTDDGGYDITVGDLRCIIGELLELAAEKRKLTAFRDDVEAVLNEHNVATDVHDLLDWVERIALDCKESAAENERLLKVEEFTKKFTRIERGKQ